MKLAKFSTIKPIRAVCSYYKLLLICVALSTCQEKLGAQVRQDSFPLVNSIFQLIERNDLPLDEIERIAENYFAEIGTGRGSGFNVEV